MKMVKDGTSFLLGLWVARYILIWFPHKLAWPRSWTGTAGTQIFWKLPDSLGIFKTLTGRNNSKWNFGFRKKKSYQKLFWFCFSELLWPSVPTWFKINKPCHYHSKTWNISRMIIKPYNGGRSVKTGHRSSHFCCQLHFFHLKFGCSAETKPSVFWR